MHTLIKLAMVRDANTVGSLNNNSYTFIVEAIDNCHYKFII